jgi:hypothetical protein
MVLYAEEFETELVEFLRDGDESRRVVSGRRQEVSELEVSAVIGHHMLLEVDPLPNPTTATP